MKKLTQAQKEALALIIATVVAMITSWSLFPLLLWVVAFVFAVSLSVPIWLMAFITVAVFNGPAEAWRSLNPKQFILILKYNGSVPDNTADDNSVPT